MGDTYPKLKVAAVQAAPVFLNREATVEKACRLIREAGANGAKVIGFPEGFVPGHPLWFHFHPATGLESRKMSAELFKNSVEIPSDVTKTLAEAARDAHAYVVMGLCERRAGSSGTLFNSQLFLGPNGEILGKHQKLMPTVGERLVHTGGYGDTLHVFKTEFGGLSGLICGENSNPLAIFALIAENTNIHVASWPNAPARGMLARSDRAAMTGRSFAFMAKAFVINVCGTLDDTIIERISYVPEDKPFLSNPAISGGSSIVAPDSRILAGPMGPEEGILYADVDLDECVHEKVVHDFAGHYNRSDVFSLTVNDNVPAIFRRVGGAAQAPVVHAELPSDSAPRDALETREERATRASSVTVNSRND